MKNIKNYPVRIDLQKLETLVDAENPQKIDYPGKVVSSGLMWEHTLPEIGKNFHVMEDKKFLIFNTTQVREIFTLNNGIMIKTDNSIYKIRIKE